MWVHPHRFRDGRLLGPLARVRQACHLVASFCGQQVQPWVSRWERGRVQDIGSPLPQAPLSGSKQFLLGLADEVDPTLAGVPGGGKPIPSHTFP